GSGVGIIVSDKWAKHIGQIRKHNGYLIEVHFFFKQLEIVVFTVYIAPNDQMKRKEAQRIIMKEIAQKKQNMHFIIMGDFNHIMQPNLDRSNSNNNNYKKLPLHGWMLKQDFIDTFRAKYRNRREFTRSNGKDNTRKLYMLLKRRDNKALWNNVTQNATKDNEKEIDINREWDNISRSIKQAAEEEIPRKKITNSSINKAPKKRYTELQSAINTIRK